MARPDYLSERAKYLARMYLTRRDDFLLRATPGEDGLDYLIELTDRGRTTGRLFGLRLRVAPSREALIRPDGRLRPRPTGEARRFLENVPYPLAVLAVVVAEPDESWVGWLKQRESLRAPLEVDAHPELAPLEPSGLDEIAGAVKRAYSAR